jgi:hypothetical protein
MHGAEEGLSYIVLLGSMTGLGEAFGGDSQP